MSQLTNSAKPSLIVATTVLDAIRSQLVAEVTVKHITWGNDVTIPSRHPG